MRGCERRERILLSAVVGDEIWSPKQYIKVALSKPLIMFHWQCALSLRILLEDLVYSRGGEFTMDQRRKIYVLIER